MKVILTQDVPKVGQKNEIVELAHGYAKNFIIKKNFGVEATKANLYKYEQQMQEANENKEKLSEIAKKDKVKLEKETFTFEASASGENMFGSISTKQIVSKLEASNININKKEIHLDHPINTLGYHEVKVNLTKEISATIKIHVVAK